MRVFFCSHLGANWMSGWQRAQTLRELGHCVVEFRQDDFPMLLSRCGRLNRLFTGKAFDDRCIQRFNENFLAGIVRSNPEIAWIEKALMLVPRTLERARELLPECIFVCFQDDDPFGFRLGERPLWKHFIEVIPMYDLHLLKKEVDQVEFRRHGARKTALFMHGFYPAIFKPLNPAPIPSQFRRDAAFVGTRVDRRMAVLNELTSKHGIRIDVYGNNWKRSLLRSRHMKAFHPAVVGEAYAMVIGTSRICLGFVSSSNRDEYSMRTFEIPACAGFLLAERTRKHLELFEEGREAEFFGSIEECAEKMRFYLANETVRLKIAEAGYRRCVESDYSLHRRMNDALRLIREVTQPVKWAS